jgi:hypothetical protein
MNNQFLWVKELAVELLNRLISESIDSLIKEGVFYENTSPEVVKIS